MYDLLLPPDIKELILKVQFTEPKQTSQMEFDFFSLKLHLGCDTVLNTPLQLYVGLDF